MKFVRNAWHVATWSGEVMLASLQRSLLKGLTTSGPPSGISISMTGN
jgi:hypothetical protein